MTDTDDHDREADDDREEQSEEGRSQYGGTEQKDLVGAESDADPEDAADGGAQEAASDTDEDEDEDDNQEGEPAQGQDVSGP